MVIKQQRHHKWLLPFTLIFSCELAFSNNEYPGYIPDEIESDGGHSLGLAHGGVAALSGQSSVKANPAMLTLEKQYTISGGFHWPAFGRPFYQTGIVDSKTSPVAAGLMYTGFQRKQKPYEEIESTLSKKDFYDSSVASRVYLGLGYILQDKIAVGVNGQHITACKNTSLFCSNKVSENTFGLGIAGLITPQLRFALSIENLGNEAVKELAPRIYRLGMAQILFNGDVTLHLDYRQRQRIAVEGFLLKTGMALTQAEILSNIEKSKQENLSEEEKLTSISTTIKTQDLLRILAGYAQSFDSSKRKYISGGVALVNDAFSFSYLVSRPYLKEANLHHALNLTLGMMF